MSNINTNTQSPSMADMLAELNRLKQENAALLAAKPKAPGISLKVSQKGAISLYGFGRFPITLYREQMTKLLAMANEINAFIQANDAALVRKGQTVAAPANTQA